MKSRVLCKRGLLCTLYTTYCNPHKSMVLYARHRQAFFDRCPRASFLPNNWLANSGKFPCPLLFQTYFPPFPPTLFQTRPKPPTVRSTLTYRCVVWGQPTRSANQRPAHPGPGGAPPSLPTPNLGACALALARARWVPSEPFFVSSLMTGEANSVVSFFGIVLRAQWVVFLGLACGGSFVREAPWLMDGMRHADCVELCRVHRTAQPAVLFCHEFITRFAPERRG